MSFDVEDWFCVRNMREVYPFTKWGDCELRVREGTDFILHSLQSRNIKATFFVLGWIAERCPQLVRDIAEEGHEIASHGYSHRTLDQLQRDDLKNEIIRSLNILRDLSGQRVEGFRAPSFSITKHNWWALDVLAECGIKYDSSLFPVNHPDYGVEGLEPGIQELGGLIEFPMTSLPYAGMRVPVSGGGYFRILPYTVSHHLLRRAVEELPSVMMYFHPWEFDPEQPRVELPFFNKFRHYTGLRQNREKFERLLDEFDFVPAKSLVDDFRQHQRGSLPC